MKPNHISMRLLRNALFSLFSRIISYPVVSITLLFLVILSSDARAITLDEALKLALEDSEATRINQHESKAIEAQAEESIAFAKPQATVDGRYLRLDTTMQTFPGFETPDWLKSGSLEASQVFWSGGRIWRSFQLRHDLYRLSELTKKSGNRDIKRDVKFAFYTVLFQRAFLDILKDRVEQRKEELNDARDLRDVGMVTSLDVRQAQLRLNNAINQLETGEESYLESLVNFNIAIGRSGNGKLLIPDGILGRPGGLEVNLGILKSVLAKGELLDIKLAKKEYSTSTLNYKIRRAEHLPALRLVGSAQASNETTGDMDETYAVGVQLTWNIIDGGLVSARTDSARAEMVIAQERVEKTRKELSGLIENLSSGASTIEKKIALQQESVNLSKENYEDARGNYRAGTITLTQLGEFNLAYATARFNLQSLFFEEQQLLVQIESLLE